MKNVLIIINKKIGDSIESSRSIEMVRMKGTIVGYDTEKQEITIKLDKQQSIVKIGHRVSIVEVK